MARRTTAGALAAVVAACVARGGRCGHSLLCPHITATLTLDWTTMVSGGKSEARIRRDMDEATASIVAVGAAEPSPTIGGASACLASDVVSEGDAYYGYVSICRYCLEEGAYELVTRDSWGDGWGPGTFTLALEGCDAVEGTQAKGSRACSPKNGREPCNVTGRVAFDAVHHPSPSPTTFRETFDFASRLDWSGATANAKRFAARVAVKSFSKRAYGSLTASGLLVPQRVYDPAPSNGNDRSRVPADAFADLPCEADAWWGFDAATDAGGGASLALQADYALPRGDYALLVAGAGDWAGGVASLADAVGYATYATASVTADGETVAYNFTVSHDYPTAAPTWAPGPVHLNLDLNWTRSFELAIVEVYRVDGKAGSRPPTRGPSAKPSRPPTASPTALPAPRPTTAAPSTLAPTTRAPTASDDDDGDDATGPPTAANATRAPTARPVPAPTTRSPSPAPSSTPSATPTPRPSHGHHALAPTPAPSPRPTPLPTRLDSALLDGGQWLTPLATSTYYDDVEGHPIDDEYSLQPRPGTLETFRYDVHADDVLLLRLYCWATGWKGGSVALTRLVDGHVLLASDADGCGTPAHPTFVDVR